jgi:CheY-like chemotaxis protein
VTELLGRRILIVEDEMLIALMLEDMLQELGCVVVGIAPRPDQAFRLIDTHRDVLDAATLDINLGYTTSHGVAAALDALGIPCLIATGYNDAPILSAWNNIPES